MVVLLWCCLCFVVLSLFCVVVLLLPDCFVVLLVWVVVRCVFLVYSFVRVCAWLFARLFELVCCVVLLCCVVVVVVLLCWFVVTW